MNTEDILNRLESQINDGSDSEDDDFLQKADTFISKSCITKKDITEVRSVLNPEQSSAETASDCKGLSKQKIIDRIHEIERKIDCKCGISDNQLKKMTKQELIELLGKFMNQSMTISCQEEIPIIQEQKKQSDYQPSSGISIDLASESLYNLNRLMANTLSVLNKNFLLDQTGISIDSFPSELEKRKEDLMPLYKQIYAEYKTEISTYLSPINLIMLINSQCMIQSVVRDGEKN